MSNNILYGANVHPDFLKKVDEEYINFTVKGTSLHLAGADRLLKNLPGYTPVGTVCQCEDIFHKNAECLPSNVEIIESYGFIATYDCGYKKWLLKVGE